MLDENRNEVELMETSEYGNTDLNSIISGDKDFAFEDSESFAKMGFSQKQFDTENMRKRMKTILSFLMSHQTTFLTKNR